MAPTEMTTKSEQPESSKEPKTAQDPSTDPSTTKHLQKTVREASELTDSATEEFLQGATSSNSNDKNPVL
ncbi:hypothetical protein DL95DRAFT_104463 [Leptodontidium sp. 2 PMI_412]|nr:hypothetical protein DL95DRAFT_104463 [Leptodontidium sp. 2 PMI_412]